MIDSKRHDYLVEIRWQDWLVWQVFIPLALIFLIWPIEKYIVESTFPFQLAFAFGDLLLYSALLLFGLTVQVKQIQAEERDKFFKPGFNLMLEFAKAAAVLFIFLFGFIKYDMINNDYFKTNPQPGKTMAFSLFSWSVTIVSIMFSIYIHTKINQELYQTTPEQRRARS